MTFLLIGLLLLQGAPLTATQSGTVIGVVKGADGKPRARIRVAAVTPPETVNDRSAGVMAAIAQTDDEGRYVLQGVPQGRYYIAAGRVDQPIYYPGTPDMTLGRIITVTPGVTISAIDFTMIDASARPQGLRILAGHSPMVPLQIHVEGGGKVPVFSNGKFPEIRLTGGSRDSVFPATQFGATVLNGSGPLDHTVSVENIPDGYALQSITHGSTDLTKSRLVLQPSAGTSAVTIVLKQIAPASPATGVTVTGRLPDRGARGIYLSGVPGTVYSDGTFEFRDVPPGLHDVAAWGGEPASRARVFGAYVAVGDRNVDGVVLEQAALLPANAAVRRQPAPAGNHAPGSVLSLATIRGTVLRGTSNEPLERGMLAITGDANSGVTLIISFDARLVGIVDGRFEIPRLLPGTYRLEGTFPGYLGVIETVVVGESDIQLELRLRR